MCRFAPSLPPTWGRLDELARDGTVRRTGDIIEVPEVRRLFVRSVCAVFDAYLSNDDTRFSRAS